MTLYQITVNGVPCSEPYDVVQKNMLLHHLENVVNDVEVIPLLDKPVLRVIEGGRGK